MLLNAAGARLCCTAGKVSQTLHLIALKAMKYDVYIDAVIFLKVKLLQA